MLNTSIAMAVLLFSKVFRINSIGIVTDVPVLLAEISEDRTKLINRMRWVAGWEGHHLKK